MKPHETFVDRCLAGNALAGEIDDHVDAWHASANDQTLAAYLGFTDEEYAAWVEHPSALKLILMSRRTHEPLADALRLIQGDLRIAARKDGDAEAAELEAWLRRTGRLGA